MRKNNVRKIKDTFFAEDLSTVTSNLKDEVLIPGLKKLMANLLKDGVDILFNGRVTRNGTKDRFFGDYVSYNTISSNKSRDVIKTTSRFSYDDIEFENRSQAEDVLEHMYAVIKRYGFVTVGEMYDMVGKTAPFTSNNYGWTDISNASVERVYGGGYVIKLPKAFPIER